MAGSMSKCKTYTEILSEYYVEQPGGVCTEAQKILIIALQQGYLTAEQVDNIIERREHNEF